MREWFGLRFRATLSYNYMSFFPLACSAGPATGGAARVESFSWRIAQPGTLVIEGRAAEHIAGAGELFSVDGLVLAGPTRSSTITGLIEIANRTTVMRITEIPPVTYTAESRCPLTNQLINRPTGFEIMAVTPQPLGISGE